MTVTSFRDREKAQVERTAKKKNTNNAINNNVFIAIKTLKRKNSSPKKMFADSEQLFYFTKTSARSSNYSR